LLEVDSASKTRRYHVDRSRLPATAVVTVPLDVLIGRMSDAGRITNTDVREALGIERSEAKRVLTVWTAQRVLERQGERRGAHYVPGPAWPPEQVP
jgi:predicted HTH transcriptional regulator